MNKRHVALALAAGFVLAAVRASAGEAESTPASTKTAGYRLKSRSAFTASETLRPPFWPIGWSPKAKVAEAAKPTPQFQLEAEMFSVTSILMGSPSLAVINGRAYGEGDTLRPARTAVGKGKAAPEPSAKGTPAALPPGVQVRLTRIFDGGISLAAEGQSITVGLRRTELTERRPVTEETLLIDVDER